MSAKKEDDIPFTIPVSSLSKKEARNEFRRAVKEHGNTEPHKIEERRIIVSERMIIIQKQIETLQLNKKAMIADHDRQLKSLSDLLEKEKEPNKILELRQQIDAVSQSKFAQINHYDTIIANQMSNQNIAELLCLVVDSETLRDEVVSKGGKKGLMRLSSACFLSNVDITTAKLYTRTRKMYDLLRVMSLAMIPKLLADLREQYEKTKDNSMERLNISTQIMELNKLSGNIVDNATDEDSDGEDYEVTEEDVVSDEEREAVKKKVHGDDL
jgi:hypothetical protein